MKLKQLGTELHLGPSYLWKSSFWRKCADNSDSDTSVYFGSIFITIFRTGTKFCYNKVKQNIRRATASVRQLSPLLLTQTDKCESFI